MSRSLPSPLRFEMNRDSTIKSDDTHLYQLPGLPSSLSVSLAEGTSIPPPPPSPPPLEKKPSLTTPERPKSNTTSAVLPSPPLTRDMPGAFPASRSSSPSVTSPQTPRNQSRGSNSYTPSAHGSEASPRSLNNTPHSNPPRRSSGLRNLLNFRRSTQVTPDSNASQGEPSRPSTPSLASTFGLSLGKTSGGRFWKRKSGTHTPGDEKSPGGSASPIPNGHNPNQAEVDARRIVPHAGRHSLTMNGRKTTKEFWRRKSSGTLNLDAFFVPKSNGVETSSKEEIPATPATPPPEIEEEPIPIPIPRITSPPPKLPELNATNENLDADDMFKNIR